MPPQCLISSQLNRRSLNLICSGSIKSQTHSCALRYAHSTPNVEEASSVTNGKQNRKPASFTWVYSKDFVPYGLVQAYLSDPYHVLHQKYKKRYEERRRDTLWWTAWTGTSISTKNIVRSYCNKKLRSIFKQALRERGLNDDGRRMATEKWPNGGFGLMGSLRLNGSKATVNANEEDLRKECLALIDKLFFKMHNVTKERNQKLRAGRKYTRSPRLGL